MNRCEDCKLWTQQYIEEISLMLGDGFTNAAISSLSDPGKANVKTNYGRCKKPLSIHHPDTPRLEELLRIEQYMLVEDGEGMGEAYLYTNKEFGCKCWEKKELTDE